MVTNSGRLPVSGHPFAFAFRNTTAKEERCRRVFDGIDRDNVIIFGSASTHGASSEGERSAGHGNDLVRWFSPP